MNPTAAVHRSALVIDDQPDVRDYLRAVLEQSGIGTVLTVGTGRDALIAVTQPGARFDLILCDLQMPDSDGVETLHAFAALGLKTWFVIMSVAESRIIETVGMLAEAQGLHVLGTLQKPIDVGQVTALIARMTEIAPAKRQETVAAPEADLSDAFLRGELRLFYQPKIHMRTRRVVAAEALVRWQHPTLGLFQPNAFVPMIERSVDFSALLNDYALQTAIACSGRWHAEGRTLRVAINLSASAFDRLDLPDRIERLAQLAGVPNDWITLEVTETQVATDATRMSQVTTRLRLKHFNLSIDDFGTGVSGLSQLRKLPFSELKIDRQFVDGCSRSPTQRSVVEASLALARDLGMTAVAEGVDDESDWNLLLSLGCDLVQGYYIARPMTEEALHEWVTEWDERNAS
jgi:EAL domain-containing protein (putative c-di-GMP-specific phosphodiesterase class I)/FixJ family two-component response regulator